MYKPVEIVKKIKQGLNKSDFVQQNLTYFTTAELIVPKGGSGVKGDTYYYSVGGALSLYILVSLRDRGVPYGTMKSVVYVLQKLSEKKLRRLHWLVLTDRNRYIPIYDEDVDLSRQHRKAFNVRKEVESFF